MENIFKGRCCLINLHREELRLSEKVADLTEIIVEEEISDKLKKRLAEQVKISGEERDKIRKILASNTFQK